MDNKLSSLFWEGYELKDSSLISESHILIHLQPIAPARCGHCQSMCLRIHDRSVRQVRDHDILGYRLTIKLPVRRVRCYACMAVCREWIEWLPPHSRFTTRLLSYVEQLVRILPILHVAQLVCLSWHTVKEIDKQRLAREVTPPDYTKVKRLIMDEFALHKGHRYATIITDAETMKVLWIGVGRTRQSIRPFFKELGSQCEHIEAVAMDQNTAFDLEVKMHCPTAEVVYDLFHVIAKYGREVIDRVRVDQANQLKHDKPGRKLIKRSRWLLLKNRQNLTDFQQIELHELMEANQSLALVYIMKEQLKDLWYADSIWDAFKRWRQWWKMAMDSDVEPLKIFCRRLRPYLRGILASAKYPLHTSGLEGINNKIKVIKRMAYGYRDIEYFFLKIKAAFPGLRR